MASTDTGIEARDSQPHEAMQQNFGEDVDEDMQTTYRSVLDKYIEFREQGFRCSLCGKTWKSGGLTKASWHIIPFAGEISKCTKSIRVENEDRQFLMHRVKPPKTKSRPRLNGVNNPERKCMRTEVRETAA